MHLQSHKYLNMIHVAAACCSSFFVYPYFTYSTPCFFMIPVTSFFFPPLMFARILYNFWVAAWWFVDFKIPENQNQGVIDKIKYLHNTGTNHPHASANLVSHQLLYLLSYTHSNHLISRLATMYNSLRHVLFAFILLSCLYRKILGHFCPWTQESWSIQKSSILIVNFVFCMPVFWSMNFLM